MILRYHILEAQFSSTELLLNTDIEYQTIQGESLNFTGTDGTLVVDDFATVVMMDVEAINGILHVVDGVLVPQEAIDILMDAQEKSESVPEPADETNITTASGTLAGVLAAEDTLAIMNTMVTELGLVETLDGDEFTVFAPSDEAFESLLAALGITASDLLAFPELVTPLVMYHVVEGTVLAEDVVTLNGEQITTVQGEVVLVTVGDDGVILTSPLGDVNVIETDIVATNGVVHIVDGVLVPQATIDALTGLGLSIGV